MRLDNNEKKQPSFEEVVSDLLKVKPQPKRKRKEKKGVQGEKTSDR